MIKTILLDMDGVLVNFTDGFFKAIGVDPVKVTPKNNWNLNTWFESDMTEDEMWDLINAQEHDFWLELEEYSWAKELVEGLMMLAPDVYISTAPSTHSSCVAGKVQWLYNHFPKEFPIERIMLGKAKQLMARPDALLIDDNDDNVSKFIQGGGYAVAFPQPWNHASYYTEKFQGYMGRVDYTLRNVVETISSELRRPS